MGVDSVAVTQVGLVEHHMQNGSGNKRLKHCQQWRSAVSHNFAAHAKADDGSGEHAAQRQPGDAQTEGGPQQPPDGQPHGESMQNHRNGQTRPGVRRF